MPSSHSPDTLVVAFDRTHAVAMPGGCSRHAGQRLGSRGSRIGWSPGDRPGAHRPGGKVLTWSRRSSPGPTASTMRMCSAPSRPPRCSATRSWRPRPSARSCACSPSATTSTSWTGSPRQSWAGRGAAGGGPGDAHDDRRGLHGLRGPPSPHARRLLWSHPPAWPPAAAGYPADAGEVLQLVSGPAGPPIEGCSTRRSKDAARAWLCYRPGRRMRKKRPGRPAP
jgi:hypothetical protein